MGYDVWELGEGGECEEFADGGEDAAVDDTHGGHEESGDDEADGDRECDGEDNGVEFCFHLFTLSVFLWCIAAHTSTMPATTPPPKAICIMESQFINHHLPP